MAGIEPKQETDEETPGIAAGHIYVTGLVPCVSNLFVRFVIIEFSFASRVLIVENANAHV
jgi:hypothetical protein